MEGYSLPAAVDSKYICIKCGRLMREPVQMVECGHRYCLRCFELLLKETDKCIYPGCEEYISKSQYYPDRAAAKDLARLQVRCANETLGCDWAGSFSQHDEHIDQCDYELQYCLNGGCDVTFLRKDARNHVETCPKRTVNCEFCAKPVQLEQMETHLGVCENRPVKCPDCQTELPNRRDLDSHVDHVTGQCPNTKISCVFSPVGCREVVIRAKMKDHQRRATSLHLNMLAGQILGISDGSAASIAAAADDDDEADVSKITKVETIVNVLSADIKRAMNNAEEAYKEAQSAHEMRLDLDRKELKIRKLRTDMEALASTTYDGTLVWRIDNVAQLRREFPEGAGIDSPTFYTAPRGYKLCARLYFNGNGVGKGKYLSLNLVVMRGDWDPLLKWPFPPYTVTFEVINQSGDSKFLDGSFNPSSSSASFKRPTDAMNVDSGCPQFCPLEALDIHKDAFLKDDTMFVKVSVDVTGYSRSLPSVPTYLPSTTEFGKKL